MIAVTLTQFDRSFQSSKINKIDKAIEDNIFYKYNKFNYNDIFKVILVNKSRGLCIYWKMCRNERNGQDAQNYVSYSKYNTCRNSKGPRFRYRVLRPVSGNQNLKTKKFVVCRMFLHCCAFYIVLHCFLIFEAIIQHLKQIRVIQLFIFSDVQYIASIFIFRSGDLLLSLIDQNLSFILKSGFTPNFGRLQGLDLVDTGEIRNVFFGKEFVTVSSSESEENQDMRLVSYVTINFRVMR